LVNERRWAIVVHGWCRCGRGAGVPIRWRCCRRVRRPKGRQERERKPSDKGNSGNQRHAEHHVSTCPPLPGPAWPGWGGAGCRSSGRTLRRGWWQLFGAVVGVPPWLRGSGRGRGCGGAVLGVLRRLFCLGCRPGGCGWGGLLCQVGAVLRGLFWRNGCRRWSCSGGVMGAPQWLFWPGRRSGG
jgi:hypothetical protein